MNAAVDRGRRSAAAIHAAIDLRDVSAERIHIIQQLPAAAGEDLGSLRLLASRVDHFWISGVLRSAVPHQTPFPIPRTLLPGAVEHPWTAFEGQPARAEQGSLVETFDRCGRLLLVLGEPGSGKTISLLEVARDLNARFHADLTQPVAVVFNLAGWEAKRMPLARWMLGELSTRYFIPRKVASRWFRSARLVPLLDGLDEVGEADRAACVEAVRTFLVSQSVSGLAVTCRTAEYAALATRLPLAAAVRLEPLTDPQVAAFLDASRRSAHPVRALLREHGELREVARTPLMLSVMLSVYGEECAGTPAGAAAQVPDGEEPTAGDWSAFLFDAYVERMVARKRAASAAYPPARLRYWLAWLAAGLERRGQPHFYLEQLQPGWLPARWQQLLYVGVVRMVVGTALLPSLELLFILVMILIDPGMEGELVPFADGWLLNTCIAGAQIGIAAALVDGTLICLNGNRGRWPGRMQWVRAVLYLAAEAVLTGGRGAGGVLLMMAMRASGTDLENDIHRVEVLHVSLRKARTGLRWALGGWVKTMVVCLPIAAVALLGTDIQSMNPELPSDGVLLAVISCFLLIPFLLSGALIRLTSVEFMESKTIPNQGMRLTARNSLVAALLYGLGATAIGVVTFATAGLVDVVLDPSEPADPDAVRSIILMALVPGLPIALFAMARFGAVDVLKHHTLRLALWMGGYTPRAYMAFLDAAVDAGLLYRVGGGYRFLHHRLQAHLADRLPQYARAAERAGGPVSRHPRMGSREPAEGILANPANSA
ncbi:MAG TPA: NACHT domain-containing protein [Longimicrobium sp.]|nr:NACHT domain-containing protein [Longimicrobium sp.]